MKITFDENIYARRRMQGTAALAASITWYSNFPRFCQIVTCNINPCNVNEADATITRALFALRASRFSLLEQDERVRAYV